MSKTAHLAIYQPHGAAREYGAWACNLYNGCSHHCDYCYCKCGVFAHTIGVGKPVLKKQLGETENDAYKTFVKELRLYRDAILEAGDGLFFSFSTDPMLREEIDLTMRCVQECVIAQVPVLILTKTTWWIQGKEAWWTHGTEDDTNDKTEGTYLECLCEWRKYITIGVTLTGHDELEPDAPTNAERITLLHHLLMCGIRTFVSLEPVVDFESSLKMIHASLHYTAEYRIGLMSPVGKQHYDWRQCDKFIDEVTTLSNTYGFIVKWKNSIRKFYESGLPLSKLLI